MHKLLHRQLRKCFDESAPLPDELARLLEMVDRAYQQADLDRSLLERSMDLTSNELLAANAELRRESEDLERRVKRRTMALREANAALQSQVTEREMANAAIKESEEKFRALFEESRDAICITTFDGILVDLNQAAVDGLGFTSREEAIGESVLQFYIDPGDRDTLLEDLSVKGFVDGREVTLQTRHGRQMIVHVTSVRVNNDRGEPEAIRTTLHDVTQSRALQNELMQAQKIEAVGRLAGGVAHDFNNLLTAIVGCSSLLEEELEPGSGEASLVEEISAAAKRGADLTQRLLAFGRQQIYVERQLDLNEVVTGIQSLLERLIGDDITIVSRLEASSGRILGDDSQLEQVIVNLGINARDAMPEGGLLTFETRDLAVDSGNSEMYPGLDPGDYVALIVRDNGIGIEEQIQDLIFEPFFSTKTSGTGLGLATVYAIVQQSKGNVRLRSQEGEGSTFEVLWPVVEATATEEPAATPATSTAVVGKGELILLVDDDGGVRSLAQRVLERQGFRAIAAASGDEAVRVFEENEDRIDILVTDVVMPGMQGPELADRLRATAPDLPVLLMSGYSESFDKLDLDASETPIAFLPKPFGPVDLVGKVRSLLDGQ